jgi:2,3-dihydroxybenzoate-AMP ligase
MLEGCVPWPEELTARYREQGYWTGDVLAEIGRRWARSDPDRIAIVAGDRRLTYGELDTLADRRAAGLRRLGVRDRDRIVVQLPNVPEFAISALAMFRLGAIPVFALPSHRRSEIAHLCETTGAVAYVAPSVHMGFDHRELAGDVRRGAPTLEHVILVGDPGPFLAFDDVDADPTPLPAPDPSDVAFFLLSGGTTGTPKLIPRTHDDYAYQLRATAEALGVSEDSAYLAALPVAHNAALGCPGLLGTLRAGGKVVLAQSPSPDEVFPAVRDEGVTHTTAMPPVVGLWMEMAELFDANLDGLVLQVGGAVLSPAMASEVRPRLGCTLTHWFGMAEGLLTYTHLDDPADVVCSSQGRPLAEADELRVVDDLGRDVPPGEVGELLARGPYTLRGYYNAAEDNERAFTADGYLRTGDLVRITGEGNLVVEGRRKDVVNRGGEKVSPAEVEEHLRAHPAVSEAAVVPVPDRVLGEKSCAWIVPRGDGPSLGDVRAFLIDRGVADFKLPDRIEIAASLPRSAVGKIDKRELARLAARVTTARAEPQPT